MLCLRRVTRRYVSWAVVGKATKEDYLQYFTEVFCGATSLDFSLLFFEHPIAWIISWLLKLAWSSLVANVQTPAKYVVARELMSIQIASNKDPRLESTWNSTLWRSWYNNLHQLRFLNLRLLGKPFLSLLLFQDNRGD